MANAEQEYREIFRVLLFENRLYEKVPVRVLIESVCRLYFPTAQESITNTFQNDLSKFLKAYSDEEEELNEQKFIEAMVF